MLKLTRSARKGLAKNKLMRRLAILAAIALTTSSCARNSAQGSVDQKTHKMCLQANDYLGCVKAQSGQATSNEKSKKQIIFNPGTATSLGNECPSGYAYTGKGYCAPVRCHYEASFGQFFKGHSDFLGGKSDWKCKYNAWYGPGLLRLEKETVRIGTNPNCPPGEPALGWNSTCEAPYIKKEKKKKNKLPMACRNGVWAKDDPKCQLPEETIPSPMDMD